MISGLLGKREALLTQRCGRVTKGMVGQSSNCALPSMCSSGTAWAKMRTGIPRVGWAFQVTHRWAGVRLKNWQLWGSSEFVADLVSNVCSLKASVTNPAASVPYETCGGGSPAPLLSPFLMRVSFLLRPGTLKSFRLLFFFTCTCLTLCLGTHITQWEDSRWLSVGVHQAC